MAYKNNCYGFVKAALDNNQYDDIFCDMRDMPLEKVVKSWKIVDVLTAGFQDSLAKTLEKNPFHVIELLNPIKQSEHLAIISQSGAIYEQNWPDWQMRLGLSLEKIMEEYKNLFGCAYYNIYAVPQDRQKNIEDFLDYMQN